ncbi:hypothetical protein BC937DRAFT_92427 [Endogone sp. FLAS-F59071]|nr:hypothetical protein BC937DRAFT_92427 [Endogone sp. FLAS-F59071]|eukprot:RUS15446.1 hypothetical protein BC937DRAFT_92427 [Endogone sp. FLAS-F59071]
MSQPSIPPALSGIVKTDSQAIVPASRRPDGTFRKEIKIRPGYTPPEDVARYSNDRLDSARVVKPEFPPGAKSEGAREGDSGDSNDSSSSSARILGANRSAKEDKGAREEAAAGRTAEREADQGRGAIARAAGED